ncbi:MAG: hypothetical protein ACLR9X_06050 [Clostridia bacterium]|nr:hypothetical protein [Clostridium sp.]
MNKKSLIICIIVVLIIILAIFIIKLNNLGKDDKKNNDIENTALVESKNNEENVNANFIDNSSSYQYTTEEVEKIKKEINATANTDIYRIEEEPGGRKILQIKPEIQFNVDLAGIIKNGEPEENELNEILKKIPNTTGIWISNQSRETFLGLLKNNGIRKF